MSGTPCARRAYTPKHLAAHYDPEPALHASGKCEVEQGMLPNHYRREAHRRGQCAIVLNICGMTQPSAAPSVTESLVSSGTTPGELPSVQRSAPIASRPARRATADGYVGFEPPDKQLLEES